MKYELLVDEEFWKDMYVELSRAKKEIYMQFMTFEGDKTGLELEETLKKAAKRGVKIKVLIDYFTDYYVSDTYYKRDSVKEEAAETTRMITRLRQAGVKIKRTRPYGKIGQYFLARNHKKLIVIDNSTYLGGINISDHNRSWHDFMVKSNNKELQKSAVEDFTNTFKGEEISVSKKGFLTSAEVAKSFFSLIETAKEEIIISSPYLVDKSIIKYLKKKKIKKKILTLDNNNLSVINWMSSYVYAKLIKDNTQIFHYKKFSHAKFAMFDRKTLLVGSSNFFNPRFLKEDGKSVD